MYLNSSDRDASWGPPKNGNMVYTYFLRRNVLLQEFTIASQQVVSKFGGVHVNLWRVVFKKFSSTKCQSFLSDQCTFSKASFKSCSCSKEN